MDTSSPHTESSCSPKEETASRTGNQRENSGKAINKTPDCPVSTQEAPSTVSPQVTALKAVATRDGTATLLRRAWSGARSERAQKCPPVYSHAALNTPDPV